MATTRILGIDLAWGDRRPDGISVWEARSRNAAKILHTGLVHGDTELLDAIARWAGAGPVLITIDGPIVCPNATGSRPVDRLTHQLFGQFHAGAHPSNSTRCVRPPRIASMLRDRGFAIGHDTAAHSRLVAEVYPHPAMVRLFGLERVVKYKRGRVAEKRAEFRRYQDLFRRCLAQDFPEVDASAAMPLLGEPWTKDIEDKTDALFCALIGWNHLRHRGRQSDIIGELDSGFILLPKTPL
jgi:predicted RNase H-like nuclease